MKGIIVIALVAFVIWIFCTLASTRIKQRRGARLLHQRRVENFERQERFKPVEKIKARSEPEAEE